MLRSLKEIIGYTIKATNGEIGKVNDFLFDDSQWIVRYLVADTGNWLIDRLVLISPYSIGKPEWKSKQFSVKLTKEQVKDSPKIENDMPVYRQEELKLTKYYGWPGYWKGMGMGGGPDAIVTLQEIPSRTDIKKNNEEIDEKYDSHLRSVNEVMKYNIKTIDDEFGQIYDIIVDDEKWQLRYFAVDTKKILPGKKVLCAIDWINSIDFSNSAVEVDMTKESIKNSPEYNPAEPINREYEEQLYDFHGRPNKWWE